MKNSLTLPIEFCPMEPGASEAGLILQRSIEIKHLFKCPGQDRQ